MDRSDTQSPQVETARILAEFLEVAITSVVFLKGLYPSGAFERRRYMNLVVQRARHPQLRDYIHSSGLVERVAVIFSNANNVPLERYVFKIMVNQSYGSMVEEGHLEFSLRSFLIKLSVSKSLSRVLPQGCRWEITAYFRSLPQVNTSKDAELWIPTDTKQWQQPPLITPIKSMSSDSLSVQLYLENPRQQLNLRWVVNAMWTLYPMNQLFRLMKLGLTRKPWICWLLSACLTFLGLLNLNHSMNVGLLQFFLRGSGRCSLLSATGQVGGMHGAFIDDLYAFLRAYCIGSGEDML
ncbi:hypothetical protein WN944_014632 [Citrus x changshan-huyou]|uniref:HORMA domain-containing protein n=1 Tax=Citrus x changshan-huyou TaxID=2935761 RepID=A0AAP0M613_9ROSI